MIIASKRLKKATNPHQYIDEFEMWGYVDEAKQRRLTIAQARRETRTSSDVTLIVSYPNGNKPPQTWNWQFLVSQAFPDAEVEVKCWTNPHPDWS